MSKQRIVTLVIFAAIFVGYFSSAAGLFNSLDVPQFFTTEALMEHQDLNLLPYQADPHFFVHPDFFMYEDQMLGLRGYMQSVFSIPLHIAGRFIAPFLITDQFPQNIQTPNFKYELAVTSLYALFMLVGLFFTWKIMVELTKNELLASIVTFSLAYGTYFWKYATMYARQPIMIMILGMAMYGFYRFFKKQKPWALGLVLLGWGLSFGIDSTLFLSITIALLFILIPLLKTLKKNKSSWIMYVAYILPGLAIFILNILGNQYWYDTFSFAQYDRHDLFASIPPNELGGFLLSVPFFPTIFYVFFSITRLDPAIFSYIEKYPKVAFIFSVEYAKKYIFYGLFAISPFFWPILLNMRTLWHSKDRMFYGVCCTIFAVGIVANTKWFAFYAANQYDIRYFYPFLLCLSPMLAFAIQKAQSPGWKKYVFNFAFTVTLVWGLYMGWLGQLSMLLPALTGERKIWVDFDNSIAVLKQYPADQIWYYTFLNYKNAGVGLVCFILLVSFYVIGKKILNTFSQRSHYARK